MSELAEKSKLLYERKLKSLLESERVRPIFGSAEAKFVSMKKWLAHRELPVERFSFVKAGFRENLTAEIWIVPAGAFAAHCYSDLNENHISKRKTDKILYRLLWPMKKQLFSFLLLFSFIVSVPAQKAQVADLVEQNLRKHVEYLASEKLEGRRTGEQGATFAAGYIANMLAQYKLKTGVSAVNTKTNFLQTFPYVSGVELGTDNFLRIIPADSTKESKMEIGVNWMPLGYSPNGYIPPSPLVFAGYGITSGELKYNDYNGLEVKDKVVLIFDGTPDAGNPHSQFGMFNLHIKANIAKEKGARALIVIATDSDFKNDRLARLSYDRTLGETAVPAVGLMRSHAAELFGAKDQKEFAEIEKWITTKKDAPPNVQSKLAEPSKAVTQIKVNLTKKQTEAYNVIGILEGNDPVLKNEAIVIGAHYDHLGRGGSSSLAANSTEIHYGADDNASGTAAVLELARLFAKEKNNKRTIIFMAFGGEEEGLLGSKYYVNNPVWPLDKTVAMVNLDMVGRLQRTLTIGGIGTSAEWRPLVARTITESNTRDLQGKMLQRAMEFQRQRASSSDPVGPRPSTPSAVSEITFGVLDLAFNEEGFGLSDHSSFYGKQIPVLFFFTGTHLDYHKPSDTAEKINYEGLARITSYVADIAKSVDQAGQKPTYTTPKVSGTAGGRMGFNVSLGTIPSYADSTDGLVLDGVRDKSPAAKAGIRAGDKILKLAGKDVRNAMDYTFVLGTMKAGEEYEVVLIRGTERLTMKIIPAPAVRR